VLEGMRVRGGRLRVASVELCEPERAVLGKN
jgi:hypothetical protein